MDSPVKSQPSKIMKITVVLSIILIAPYPLFGVPVAKFQMDGQFIAENTMTYKRSIQPTDTFTLCFRIYFSFLRGQDTGVMYFNDNALSVSVIQLDNQNSDDLNVSMAICKYRTRGMGCASHSFQKFVFEKWYHVCGTFNVQIAPTNIIISTKFYLDGALTNQQTTNLQPPSLYQPLYSVDNFQLGRDPSNKYRDFSGKLAQVELWAGELNKEQIMKLSSCEVASVETNQKLISWPEVGLDELWAWLNVTVSEEGNVCEDSEFREKLVIAHKVSHDNFETICSVLGGMLAVPRDPSEAESLNNHSRSLFQSMFGQKDQIRDCYDTNGALTIWIGAMKNTSASGRNMWLDPYSGELLVNLSIISDFSDDNNCSALIGANVASAPCNVPYSCGICYLSNQSRTLRLKGLCHDDVRMKEYYDVKFRPYGTINGRPLFKGIQSSIIYFNSTDEKWYLRSLREPSKFLRTYKKLRNSIPVGTLKWEVASEQATCDLPAGSVRELTFSRCFPGMFTCNSGHCIGLSAKCDSELNCKDKSDEFKCEFLQFSKNYVKSLIPRDSLRPSKPTEVFINVSVLAFPLIDTVNLKFTADFYLSLRWYDERLEYKDLNNITYLNSLGETNLNAIWIPKLGFTNALGPYQTILDGKTTGTIVKEEQHLDEDISLATEAMLFSGKNNSIWLTREYYLEYGCNFDLLYYPFDTQLCSLVFDVQGKTDDYIRLQKDGQGIEFLGGRLLVEYEIQLEDLNVMSVNNVSRAVVKFVFRRRMEFHVANTFFQTFLLAVVGYLTYFFAIDGFANRVMVTLTTMLVFSTIMASIQQGLPKTAYYKFIDYWMIFYLNVLVVTLVFHTYLAHVISKKAQPVESTRVLRHQVPTRIKVNSRRLNISNSEKFSVERQAATEDSNTRAKRLNQLGRSMYIIIIIFFNVIFWTLAIREYSKSADNYIHQTK